MTIHIPDWAIVVLQAYLITGAALWLPLQFWANRFVSPKRPTLERLNDASLLRRVRSLLGVAAMWPWLVKELSVDEWKYGLGQKCRHARCNRSLDGCCASCSGRGVDASSPETNGTCWDCRGTGHPHS